MAKHFILQSVVIISQMFLPATLQQRLNSFECESLPVILVKEITYFVIELAKRTNRKKKAEESSAKVRMVDVAQTV